MELARRQPPISSFGATSFSCKNSSAQETASTAKTIAPLSPFRLRRLLPSRFPAAWPVSQMAGQHRFGYVTLT